jgi:hypothetical protein
MKSLTAPLLVAALVVAGCSKAARHEQAPSNQPEHYPPMSAEIANTPAPQDNSAARAASNQALAEPKGPIDPKSAEAAAQVVQQYGALIEQGRWTESWKLWSDASAAKQFDRNWRDDSEVHMEIGKPGDMEGAAGSSYVTVPVTFYGQKTSGGSFREKAAITLRRVNDVPGSTESQRRWHIANIDLSPSSAPR